jgi:GNAT superfamily N-acetyltransferase
MTEADADVVAALHVASWRSAYRGVLRDELLDGDMMPFRLGFWRARLGGPGARQFGWLALAEGEPVGFAFALGGADPAWGTQIDNLHVLPAHKRRGIGRRLLAEVGAWYLASAPGEGLFLWVYEQNAAARRFYERLGAAAVERMVIDAPGGGQVAEWRYAWPSSAALLDALRAALPHA